MRANLPVNYSEGFNPHQKTSFALPLGVGIESTGEYVEIELNESFSEQKILQHLNEVMPEGLIFVDAKEVPKGKKAAAAEVEAAIYEVRFSEIIDLEENLLAIMDMKEILVEKKTKKGIKQVDIRQDIFVMERLPDNQHTVKMLIAAGSANNLKPSLVAEVIIKQMRIPNPDIVYKRIDLLKREGKEFVSLGHM